MNDEIEQKAREIAKLANSNKLFYMRYSSDYCTTDYDLNRGYNFYQSGVYDGAYEALQQSRKEVEELQAKCAELEETVGRLKYYIRHKEVCAIIGGYGYCDCGLEQALKDKAGE